MSQPRDPYGRPYQEPYRQPPYGQQPPQYGQQPAYPAQQQPYPPRPQQPYPPRQQYPQQYQRPAAPPPAPSRPSVRVPRRIPGLGLILTAASLVIQVVSLIVLPFLTAGPASASLPTLWHAAAQFGTHGFGQWYLVLFSYPLAALGILLALASVLDSVALKVIWAGLTIVGLGYLVLRYGLAPIVGFGADKAGLHFTRQEITTAVIAVAALVVVIFVLKTALSMFRRVAGLILLGFAALHTAAIVDLAKDSVSPGIGAYGPAVGYILVAVAAFIGPKRIPGV
jgi:hypothetical protein